jgi:soluble lytic murein transglycosylase-like protein
MVALPALSRCRCARHALLPLLALGLAVVPAGAELVLLADGEVLKVESVTLDERNAALTLPGGGVMRIPVLRVDRVLADEVVPEVLVAPAPPPVALPPAVVAVALRYDPTVHGQPSVPYGDLIFDVAKRNQVNPALVAAVVRAESSFDPRAVSYKGARGLMQLMPATAERFGVGYRDLFTVASNLEAGTKYLSWLIDHFGGQAELVIAAYNAGENAVARYGGVPPYRETRGYVERVMKLLTAG